MQVKLLCIGDIVGRPGRQILSECLQKIVTEHEIDCVIANAENAAGGSGLTRQIYDKLMKYGVNLITLGDHVYRKREIIDTLQNADNIIRPANLSHQAAGKEWAVYRTQRGVAVGVAAVLGRMHMPLPVDNPFHAIDRVMSKMPAEAKIRVVEVHGEVTSEKIAMGWYLNGKVSLVYGTHTHVVTGDECILNKGTAYITDLGMTGPHESVLGRNIDPVLKSLTTQMPYPYSIATNDLRINGIVVTLENNGHNTFAEAKNIQRICVRLEDGNMTAYDQDDGKPDRM